jgi:hypothetical protein
MWNQSSSSACGLPAGALRRFVFRVCGRFIDRCGDMLFCLLRAFVWCCGDSFFSFEQPCIEY